MDHVFGYAVGLDMTRRDLQGEAKKLGRPWEIGKAFEHSAPCGPLVPAERVGPLTQGAVTLEVNGETRQQGDVNQMIWKIPEMISYLSDYFTLAPGEARRSPRRARRGRRRTERPRRLTGTGAAFHAMGPPASGGPPASVGLRAAGFGTRPR